MPPKVNDLGSQSISALRLAPDVEKALREVIAQLGDDYRDSFIALVEALSRQASALDRIQTTLSILVQKIAPELGDRIPAAIAVAREGTAPDLASAVVVADPIGAGYTLSQEALAKALGISASDLSILARAWKLSADGNCAVVVRKGPQRNTVNYHPRAIVRFRELVANVQPTSLNRDQKAALRRVQTAFALAGT